MPLRMSRRVLAISRATIPPKWLARISTRYGRAPLPSAREARCCRWETIGWASAAPERGVHDDHRPGRQGVMPGGDADKLLAAGDGAGVLEGPGIDKVLLEESIRASAVGPDGPDGLDEGPTALVIFPAEIAHRAVVQSVRQVIAVLVRAEAADAGAVGFHHIEVAACFVLVVFVALERGAAPLRDKYNVATGGISRVQVAPLSRGELAQVPPIDANLEDMGGFHRPAEVITAGTIQPAVGRLIGRRPRKSEHDAAAIPPKVHAVQMSRAEGAVEDGAKV